MSFNFEMQALEEVLPSIASKKVGAGGYMVLRPDSGDPVEAVLMALHAGEKVNIFQIQCCCQRLQCPHQSSACMTLPTRHSRPRLWVTTILSIEPTAVSAAICCSQFPPHLIVWNEHVHKGPVLVQVFGCDVNDKGYRKPLGWGVIQGDGINIATLGHIMDAVLDAGFSAEVSPRVPGP